MRPGLRYKIMWAGFYLVTLIASIAAPWHGAGLWIGVAVAWAICAYISFRKAPATA